MTQIATERVTIGQMDGPAVDADLLLCPNCGRNQFYAYRIDGQDHYHLQCTLCNTSYCQPGGACHQPAQPGTSYSVDHDITDLLPPALGG